MQITQELLEEHYLDVDQSVYDYMRQYTKHFLDEYAYRFFKRNISYRNSSQQIEKIAKVLQGTGVCQGDVVAVISPMLPEVVSSFYAFSKVGASFFPIDPRTNASRIRDFLNLAEVKHVFCIDMAYGKLDAIIDQTKVQDVVVISVMDSMFPFLSFFYHRNQINLSNKYYCIDSDYEELRRIYVNLDKDEKRGIDVSYNKKALEKYFKMRDAALKNTYYTNPPKEGYVSLKDAITNSSYLPTVHSVKYDASIPASLTLTSGTTGKPKVVPTKSRSYNVKVRDYSYTTMPIELGDRMLSMPPFILYGEIFMHMAYVRGVQNVIIPDITAYHYPDVILREKINHAVGVPSQALTLADEKQKKGCYFKHLKSVSVGGTKMLQEHERKINESLLEEGIQVTQGYSATELTPASMTNMPGATKTGSVGRAIGDSKPVIVSADTMEVLDVGEIGRLLVKSETQFEGYYKNPEITKKVLVEFHGETYVDTGDRAYVDEDGYYFIQGRDKEMIIRPDGHNNFPAEMEELLACHPFVQDCAVVGVPFPDYESPTGEYPKAHIVLKEECRGEEALVIEQLKAYCLDHLPERDVPIYYRVHDQLPLTPVLKTDKLELERMDKEEYFEQQKHCKVKVK